MRFAPVKCDISWGAWQILTKVKKTRGRQNTAVEREVSAEDAPRLHPRDPNPFKACRSIPTLIAQILSFLQLAGGSHLEIGT